MVRRSKKRTSESSSGSPKVQPMPWPSRTLPTSKPCTARHQPARIVVDVLEIERPGEVDLAVDLGEILVRKIGTAIFDVGMSIHDVVELAPVDSREDAAEPEQHPVFQPLGQPGDESDRRLAADQAEITDNPRLAIGWRGPLRFRRRGNRWM